ncbi:MAG: nucleoside-diphosphate sugar epimerase/dehydratase [Chloroflexota bacterium]
MHITKRIRLHGLTFLRDALIVGLAYAAGAATRFDGRVPNRYASSLALWLPAIIFVYSACSYRFGLHRRVWRYVGMDDLRAIAEAAGLSVLIVVAADLVGRQHYLPVSVIVAGGVYSLCGLLAIRLWPRLVPKSSASGQASLRILIIGAGHAGQLVATDVRANGQNEHAVGFLDDDPRLTDMSIQGLRILGTIDELPEIVRRENIDGVAVALPSATTRQLDRVLALAQTTDVRIQMLPSQAEVLAGRSSSMQLRDVNLDSLLDRIPSSAAMQGQLVQGCVRGRVVLVTGAAGSIGSELCRQIITLGPSLLLALDNNETGLFHLQRELAALPGGDLLVPVLTSVTADPKIRQVFERHRPDIVFHAAAYKHVPMLQSHSDEAVFVNVKGTLNLCHWASHFGCERFVFVSTDKAVDPVNTLGFSKRIGELLVRAHQTRSNTIFCSVRFGNVIGSRGSALPEFVRQIDAGGPVTVTHPDVERYFMTISEAVSLVIQAGALATGGELFMLDMGAPIKIGDLVKRLIRLRGLRIGKDIEIVYTGLRPGEKLSEELVFEAERTSPTEIASIHVVTDTVTPNLDDLEQSVARLVRIASQGATALVDSSIVSVARGGSIGRRDPEAAQSRAGN